MMLVSVSGGRSGWQGMIAGEREVKKALRQTQSIQEGVPLCLHRCAIPSLAMDRTTVPGTGQATREHGNE